MESHTDDELIRIYEAALGPLHNPSPEWLADALVWTRRIISVQSLDEAVSVAAVWTGEPQGEARELAESLRAAAGLTTPAPEPVPPPAPWMVHVSAIDGVEQSHGSGSGSRYHPLSAGTGGGALGCSLYVVDPGKRAFHVRSEVGGVEAIFVVEGEGVLCLGAAEHAARAGSYCRIPTAPEDVYQLYNTGPSPLRYLFISATERPSQER